MVNVEGVKPSSAAKLLKIKESTAKEILKNFKHPSLPTDNKNLEQSEKNIENSSEKAPAVK